MSQAVEEGILSTSKGSSEAIASEAQHAYGAGADLISKLPTRGTGPLFLYKNFWFRRGFLERILILQANFKARPDDIILATNPKCGSTWLKAIVFAITGRSRHDFSDHPLLTRHPHQIIPTLDVEVPLNGDLSCIEALKSPRILSTHTPFSLLPACIGDLGCRMVYICRDPKDVLISQWHFVCQFFGEKPDDINVAFDMFCQGVSVYGPFWDHCLEYWKESVANPDRLLFLKYEEMMSEPVESVKKLAAFLGAPVHP